MWAYVLWLQITSVMLTGDLGEMITEQVAEKLTKPDAIADRRADARADTKQDAEQFTFRFCRRHFDFSDHCQSVSSHRSHPLYGLAAGTLFLTT